MFFNSEDVNATVIHPERLHSFKYGLTIMQRQAGRAEGEIREGNQLGHIPLALLNNHLTSI